MDQIKPPILSIVVPTFNEADHIDQLIKHLLAAWPQEKELFIVDGGSTDGTQAAVNRWAQGHDNVFLVNNQQRYVSHGFNLAFNLSKGQYLTLMGAHADYPLDYFQHALDVLESNQAEAVGGPLRQHGRSDMGKAIAACMSSKFGVGGTEFRTSTHKHYVDSVAMAVYKRSLFEQLGILDEELIRNQDDEWHYRINAAGYRILMIPEMACDYFVRENLSGLYQQYYQYGLYKPLVIKKVRSGVRIRHLIPFFFVLYLLSLPIAIFFKWWLIPLGAYFIMNLFFSLRIPGKFKIKLLSMRVFPVLHLAYGAGFLMGLRKI